MRIIDADALFEKVKESSEDAGFYTPIYNGFLASIVNAPTIEQPKWISVEDGLPETIVCSSAGTAYSAVVNVLTSGRKVITALFDGEEFICDAEFWEAEDEEVTHWAPVLSPLPEPPKGDE